MEASPPPRPAMRQGSRRLLITWRRPGKPCQTPVFPRPRGRQISIAKFKGRMSGQRKAFARVVDVGDSERRAEPTTARAPKSSRPSRRRRAKGECSKQYNRISPAFHPIFFQKLSKPCGTSVGPWRALRRKTQIAGDAATRPRPIGEDQPAKPMKRTCRKTALRRSTFVPRKITEL